MRYSKILLAYNGTQEGRRALFYGGGFCLFVLAVGIAAAIGVILDMPPKI